MAGLFSYMMIFYIFSIIDSFFNETVLLKNSQKKSEYNFRTYFLIIFGAIIIYIFILGTRVKYQDNLLQKPLSTINSAKKAELLFYILWSMAESLGNDGNFIKFIGFLQINHNVLKEDCPVITELLANNFLIGEAKYEIHEINTELQDIIPGLQDTFLLQFLGYLIKKFDTYSRFYIYQANIELYKFGHRWQSLYK